MTQLLASCQNLQKDFLSFYRLWPDLSQELLSEASERRTPSPPAGREGAQLNNSLTMTYFHTGICTIIGAKSFHCPVRDGKEWDQLAMVVRHNGLPC